MQTRWFHCWFSLVPESLTKCICPISNANRMVPPLVQLGSTWFQHAGVAVLQNATSNICASVPLGPTSLATESVCQVVAGWGQELHWGSTWSQSGGLLVSVLRAAGLSGPRFCRLSPKPERNQNSIWSESDHIEFWLRFVWVRFARQFGIRLFYLIVGGSGTRSRNCHAVFGSQSFHHRNKSSQKVPDFRHRLSQLCYFTFLSQNIYNPPGPCSWLWLPPLNDAITLGCHTPFEQNIMSHSLTILKR